MISRTEIQRGDTVRVSTVRGWVERVVVAVESERVFVCTPSGFEAIERGENASVLGFRLRDVEQTADA